MQAFKSQVELDVDLRQLISELREALAQAQDCRAAASVPGASRTIHAVLQLVLEGAALIDPEEDYMTIAAAEEQMSLTESARKRDVDGAKAKLRGAPPPPPRLFPSTHH